MVGILPGDGKDGHEPFGRDAKPLFQFLRNVGPGCFSLVDECGVSLESDPGSPLESVVTPPEHNRPFVD